LAAECRLLQPLDHRLPARTGADAHPRSDERNETAGFVVAHEPGEHLLEILPRLLERQLLHARDWRPMLHQPATEWQGKMAAGTSVCVQRQHRDIVPRRDLREKKRGSPAGRRADTLCYNGEFFTRTASR